MKKTLLYAMLLSAASLFSCTNSTQNSVEEEDKIEVTYPNITAQGVGQFAVGSSLIDIPPQGNFYDTILIHKTFEVWDGDVRVSDFEQITNDEELSKYLKNSSDPSSVSVETNMLGYVIKGQDTLLIVKADKNAKIEGLLVQSDKLSMENGVHVGLTSKEMVENFDSKLGYDHVEFPEATVEYMFAAKPDNIKVFSNHTFTCFGAGDGNWDGMKEDGTIILSKVADWRVGGILILKDSKDYDVENVLQPLIHYVDE